MAANQTTASGKIVRNSLWFGLETVLEAVIFLGTSIAIARYLGPAKLGYFSYVNFFVMVVTRTSGSGLATATRKYMSEFLGQDQPGVARAVYYLAWRFQLLGAFVLSGVGVAAVLLFGDASYRLMSLILVLSVIPGVMSWVPAQANNALEDVAPNTISAIGYILCYTVIVVLSIVFRWDLVGIAAATLIGRLCEVVLRTIPLHRRLAAFPRAAVPAELSARIRRFCIEALGIQLLMSVVWERSELIFLKAFCAPEQLAFYSISFGLANNLLLVPRTFSSAVGVSLMVDASRDPSRIRGIVSNAARFLLLVIFPVHLGAAAICHSAIGVTYGARYAGAIPVLIIAAILSIPRGFQEIPEILLKAADRQRPLFYWLIATGVFNIALDAILIPRFGAVGAAWGNGLAQALGITAIWQQARRSYTFSLPLGSAFRLFAAGLVMAAVAFGITHAVPGLLGLIAAIAIAIPLYVLTVKLFGALDASDRERLAPFAKRMPAAVQRVFVATVDFVTPGI